MDVISKGKESNWRPPGWPGPVFCLFLGVSSDSVQPITGQVTEVTWPAIGRAQSELTLSKRQKMGPGFEPRSQVHSRMHTTRHTPMLACSTCPHLYILYYIACQYIYIYCISLTQLIKSRQNRDHISWPILKRKCHQFLMQSVMEISPKWK